MKTFDDVLRELKTGDLATTDQIKTVAEYFEEQINELKKQIANLKLTSYL